MHTSTPVLPGLSHWWWEDGRWYRGRFFLPCLIRRNLVGRIFPVASVRALVELVGLRHWISAQTLSFNCSWSQDRNSIQPSRAATMWLVTTHEAFQLSWADRVGSSSASFFCFVAILVTYCHFVDSSTQFDIIGIKSLLWASSTSSNNSPIPGVTHCTNPTPFGGILHPIIHALLCSTPAILFTTSVQPPTVSLIHAVCVAESTV